jgi:hypothetical protein
MQGFTYEFLKQIALYTLEKDLNGSQEDIQRFKNAFNDNLIYYSQNIIDLVEIEEKKNFMSEPDPRADKENRQDLHKWNFGKDR